MQQRPANGVEMPGDCDAHQVLRIVGSRERQVVGDVFAVWRGGSYVVFQNRILATLWKIIGHDGDSGWHIGQPIDPSWAAHSREVIEAALLPRRE